WDLRESPAFPPCHHHGWTCDRCIAGQRASVSVHATARTDKGVYRSSCAVPSTVQHAAEAFADDAFGFTHDAIDQFLHRRHIMDQTSHHAAGPGPGIHLTGFHDARINASHFLDDILELDVRAQALFLLQQALDSGVV